MPPANVHPKRNPFPQPPRDDRSPRDWRRYWAAVLPRQRTFRNARARLLAEWADAIAHEDTLEAFMARHPDGIDLPGDDR